MRRNPDSEPTERPVPRHPLPIHVVLPNVIVAATVETFVLGMLTWWALGRSNAGIGDVIEAFKLVLAVVAGFGAVVALVVAYRRQKYNEIADFRAEQAELRERTRLMNERFGSAIEQLGHDSPAIRLGGVHALAGLADDWAEGCQTCIDVLCSYVRMPFESEPSSDDTAAWMTWRAFSDVRDTVLSLIAGHLRTGEWDGRTFDLSGITLSKKLDLSGLSGAAQQAGCGVERGRPARQLHAPRV